MNLFRLFFLLSLLFSLHAPRAAAQGQNHLNSAGNAAAMFPFALPPFDDSKSATDVSWMNSRPAGSDGFVRVEGENFVDGRGNPLRFWGVNISFSGVFPPKDQAPKIAARLAKYGFNSARIHHFEGYPAPNGIWKPFGIGSSRVRLPREFDSEQLDRFDFFMSELIKHGIYLNLNLHVGRKVQSGEGLPQANSLPDKDKGVNYYDEKLIEASQEFARQLLTHVNPYTGRSYADEPGVGAVEITNENSLLGMWLDGSFSKIPELYQEPLRVRWNQWLREKYDESTLRAAWTELDDPLDRDDLLAYPLPIGIVNPHAPDARQIIGQQVLERFTPKTDSGARIHASVQPFSGPKIRGAARPGLTLNLQNLGNEKWGFQLNRDGLALQDNQPYTLSFWARSDLPRRLSVNLWQDSQPYAFLGFTGYADLRPEWREFTFVFRPQNPEVHGVRLNFNFGNSLGAVGLSEVELRSGGRLAAPSNWSLEAGIPLIELRTTQVWNARRDFAQFLGEVEHDYVAGMKKFLREELNVRCPLWNSQAQFGGWGGVWREKDSDAVDVHAYWKHPVFGSAGWNDSVWSVGNSSMTTVPGIDPLSGFAFYRLKGKPFVMSEWNSGQPNDFGAESLPMIATYAAWQNWAAIYIFDYHSSGEYDRDAIRGYFSIDSHPAKMATAPTAALIFRRPQAASSSSEKQPPLGDARLAHREYTLTVPPEFLWLKVASSSGQPTPALVLPAWREAGVARGAPLRGKVTVEFGDAAFATADRIDRDPVPGFTSDTREVKWNRTPSYYSFNAAQSKLATGFLGGYRLSLNELKMTFPPRGNRFVTVLFSSLDSKPIPESGRLLLTAVGKAENIGMGWNTARDSVGSNWGRGPTQVEGVEAEIELLTDARKLKVFALGNKGERVKQVPANLKAGVLRFKIAPAWRTVWYEIAVE